MSTPPQDKPVQKPSGANEATAPGAKVDKKAAKQAKRAQAKQQPAGGGGVGTGEGAPPSTPLAGSGGGQHQKTQRGGTPATAGRSNAVSSPSTPSNAPLPSTPTTTTAPTPASDPLQLFLHLDLPSSSSSLSHSSKASTSNIHPSIIKLALQYAEFKIVGANARCIAMLEALKDVIRSYNPPPSTSLSRHLPTTHLNPQINHLVRARPLSVSMGTAIRYLKFEIGTIGTEVGVDEAKSHLLTLIDTFIRDRILLADKVIQQHAINKIKDGEVILTYARSSVVEGCLLEAKKVGREFEVVCVDSGPLFEGKNLLRSLRAAGIATTYVLLPSISVILPRITLCLLGTHSLLSNGSMFSRAGTAIVAMMLKERHVPVVCCCETYKFSERVMLDSIVGNEMGSTETMPPEPNLSPLSLLYDVSRPEDVSAVITEAGLIPVQSVGVMLRDYKPLM